MWVRPLLLFTFTLQCVQCGVDNGRSVAIVVRHDGIEPS